MNGPGAEILHGNGAPALSRGIIHNRRGMIRNELSVYGGTALFGVLVALALARPFPARGAPDAPETPKMLLLREADLDALHHRVYEQVGPEVWEYTVKPEFLRAITLETVRSTGNLWPEEKDVVDWVRDHPEEARTIMRDLGARFERAGGGAP